MDLPDLMTKFRGPLIGYFAAQGNGPQAARELAQDAFAEAFASQQRFVGNTSDLDATGAWLRGIARNLLLTEQRRIRRAPQPLTTVDVVDPTATSPCRAAADTESQTRLHNHIDELPEQWRTVLYMHYLEGSSLAAIGALLGISARAVEGRLHRARVELKRSLTRADRAAADLPYADLPRTEETNS